MNPGTMLLRQIHPNFVQADEVSSQAFRPTPKDNHRLSVYDGDKITPEKSWSHYTATLGNQSAGTMGLLVDECSAANVSVHADPDPFPEHCIIDFTQLATKSEIEKAAKLLKRVANRRGWLHRP